MFSHRLRYSVHLINMLADFDHEDTTSKSGQVRDWSRAACHKRTLKRRRSSSSSTSASRTKRGPVNNRRASTKLNSENDGDGDGDGDDDDDDGDGDDGDDDDDEIDELEGAETETQMIRIADVYPYYYDIAFRTINQLAIKDILKAWIKFCHPGKQTNFPYNGGKAGPHRDGNPGSDASLAEYGYLGHHTSPDYWPSDKNWSAGMGARHREPDHVKKAGWCNYHLVPMWALTSLLERMILLPHLLRSQHKGFKNGDFSLKTLRRSTKRIHLEFPKHFTTGFVNRLTEIYDVREKEMKFEAGQMGETRSDWWHSSYHSNIGSDGDTLVPVQMPISRSKARNAPKRAVKVIKAAKAASSRSDQLKVEPVEATSITCNAPTANMGVNAQIEGGDTDLSEGSEPSIFADTSSSTEEAAPDVSCSEPVLCRSPTVPHGLPFLDSPSPIDRRHSSVQEHWTLQSASLGREPIAFTHPSPFDSIATPANVHRSLPLHDQYRFGSASTQSFPSQDVSYLQDHESTASQRVANRVRPSRSFNHSPLVRPFAPKVENIRHSGFASSSSGVAGYYSSGQTDDFSNAYTVVGDSSTSLWPSMNASFSSSCSDGTQLATWNDGNQPMMPRYHQDLHENLPYRLSLQAIGVPQHQPLGINMPSGDNPDQTNQLLYTTDFRTHTSLGAEHKFDPFSQGQQHF